jgi:hypothetical protein
MLQSRKRTLSMTRLQSLSKLRVPLGGQEIELQQVDFEAGGMSLLRTRIREASRFTIFDIDPATAQQWGEALLAWARAQPRD